MPLRRLFVSVGELQNGGFAAMRAADLQAYGNPLRVNPQGTEMVGKPYLLKGEVFRNVRRRMSEILFGIAGSR